MPIDAKYLFEAKETIDKALALAESGVQDDDKVEQVLVDAGDKACQALNRLKNHSEYWAQFTRPTKRSVIEALKANILQSEKHFEIAVLPVCGEVLVRLGYKPPEDARPFVARAQEDCRRLNENTYDLASCVTEARRLVGELAQHTCQLAEEGVKRLKRTEQLKNLRRKLQSVLKFVASTLASAVLTMAVESPEALRRNMTEAGRAAICVLATENVALQARLGCQAAQAPDGAGQDIFEKTGKEDDTDQPG